MSSSRGSETQSAAFDKADEGWRLLSAGDYEGAIAACAEAIELDFSSLGARRTRAEACKRLGREYEAGADLRLLAGQSYHVVDEGSGWSTICTLGFGLGLIGGGVWGIAAPWVTDVTLWWPTMLGIIGLLSGLGVAATPPRFSNLINYSFPISKSGRVRVGIFPIFCFSDLQDGTLIGVIAKTTGQRSTCIGLAGAISERHAYSLLVSLSDHNAYSLLVSFAPNWAWGVLNMLSGFVTEGSGGGDYPTY